MNELLRALLNMPTPYVQAHHEKLQTSLWSKNLFGTAPLVVMGAMIDGSIVFAAGREGRISGVIPSAKDWATPWFVVLKNNKKRKEEDEFLTTTREE